MALADPTIQVVDARSGRPFSARRRPEPRAGCPRDTSGQRNLPPIRKWLEDGLSEMIGPRAFTMRCGATASTDETRVNLSARSGRLGGDSSSLRLHAGIGPIRRQALFLWTEWSRRDAPIARAIRQHADESALRDGGPRRVRPLPENIPVSQKTEPSREHIPPVPSRAIRPFRGAAGIRESAPPRIPPRPHRRALQKTQISSADRQGRQPARSPRSRIDNRRRPRVMVS